MKIGLNTFFQGIQRGPLSRFLGEIGSILDERDFASIWLAEHAVAFAEYDPNDTYPYSEDGVPPKLLKGGMLDPLSVLHALAMCTSKVKLCTGIAILPQRNPVYFAKMGAAIDLLSNGRFVAGLGLGWSSQEFAALNVPFERRGARMNDHIGVITSLWTDEISQYSGEFFTLPPCIQLPKPLQTPHPPIYLGGEGAAALRRAAMLGQGWFGYRLLPEDLPARLEKLQSCLTEQGKAHADFDVIVSPAEKPIGLDDLQRYAELGVSQVILPILSEDIDEFRRQADLIANSLVVPAAGI